VAATRIVWAKLPANKQKIFQDISGLFFSVFCYIYNMDRKEFIAIVGTTAGGVLFASCFSSCKKKDDDAPAQSIDLTLDLNASSNAALKNNGGFVVSQGVIVAKTSAGAYVAVASACTHEGTTVQYDNTNSRFHCPNHGSNFSTSGTVINGPAGSPLKQYNIELNGSSLRVFS
jgi:cytochrome b6-f complex iron-sulfur subunit